MIVIGVSGKYCTGKSTVSHFIASRGYKEVDVDALGHVALNESYDELIHVFSDTIATPSKEIDRAILKKIVFSDSEKLRQLESIVHPKMVEQIRKEIEEEEKKRGKSNNY